MVIIALSGRLSCKGAVVGDKADHIPQGRGTRPTEEDLFFPLDRFNAFSDGVFAIAITLLVIELPVPPADALMLSALLNTWHDFLGYLISFVFIGSIWLTHSDLTKLMKRGDKLASGINVLVLLFVAVLPFSTSLMVTHLDAPDIGVAVLLYGLNVVLASLVLSLLILYVSRESALLVEDNVSERLRRLYRQRWAAIGLNVFALAIALVAPLIAVGLYLITTALLLVLPLVSLRRHWRRSRAV
jgi:TMEM175 potassium channel family protein